MHLSSPAAHLSFNWTGPCINTPPPPPPFPVLPSSLAKSQSYSEAMVTKPKDQDGDSSNRLGLSHQEHKRRPPPNDHRTVFGGIPMEEFVSLLQPWVETSVRGIVGEEMKRALSLSREPYMSPSFSLSENSQRCNLELRFVNEVSHTLYSGIRIEADGGTPLRIMLFDRGTRETVISGPFSSLKVEIVVVSSEFSSDDEWEDWTMENFNQSVMRERKGKRPLLTGEISTTLKGGVGTIGSITFTDNSSWTRRKKFRLGARVVWRMPTEARVREAVSNPFSVKDHRGERCKKHHPPFLHDEVWRLEQIRKDGPLHDRLRSHGIATVLDFLRQYEVDPSVLKSILGASTCRRTWNEIVSHANTCVVDDRKFSSCYFPLENVFLMFNSVYRVVAANFSNLNYVPLESLTLRQKAIVESLKMEAYKRRSEWLPVADWTPNLLKNEPSIHFPVMDQSTRTKTPPRGPDINSLSLGIPGQLSSSTVLRCCSTHFYAGQQGVVQEPILSPASYNYESAGYQQQGLLQSPETIHWFRVLDAGEACQVSLGEFGYDTQVAAPEYVFQGIGDEQCCQWLPGSSSCSTWVEGQPPLVNAAE